MEENSLDNQVNNPEPFFSGARGVAVRILSRFERSDAYLDKLLDYEFRTGNLSALDKSLMTEILYGVIRWRGKLDFVLNGFYHGDYMKCLNLVKNALRTALYQILFLDKIPIPVAINESVELIKKIQGEKIAGIVNGVLRNIARNIDNIRFPIKDDDPIYYLTVMESHPRWMVRRWVQRFGVEKAEALMELNNRRPNTAIRVNTLKTKIDEIKEILKEREIEFETSPYLSDSLIITGSKIKVPALDLFKSGFITIQDISASMASKLADARPGMKILDMCAAPGGKSMYMAEAAQDKAEICAIDKYSVKMDIIQESADRMGIKSINVACEDAMEFQSEAHYDIVFVDAPCSGLGTLAKKPDIKWKREREDIYKLADTQKGILRNAAALVKVGGAIIYSTCTIEPEENMDNVNWFLKEFPEFEIDPAENYLPAEVCADGAMQTFPHEHGIDGAFAIRLIKK
jgi:16S rRNA (cytosine967-C5)-methyltransferase